jgi:hypothetical protein
MIINNLQKGGVTAAVASFLVISQPAQALTLLGNDPSLGSASDPGLSVSRTATNTRVNQFTTRSTVTDIDAYLSFTLPQGTNYRLNTVSLRLAGFTSSFNNVTSLRILSDANLASVDPSGTVVAFNDFSAPISIGDADSTIGTFGFNPNSPFVFIAGTKYWLELGGLNDNGISFRWVESGNLGNVPLGIASFNGYVSRTFVRTTTRTIGRPASIRVRTSYSTSTLNPSFNIDATPVPFEFNPALGLGVIGGFFLVRKVLKKKA